MKISIHARRAFVLLVAAATLMLAGCSGNPPKPDQATIIKEMAVSNNAVVLRQLDLALEREKTKQIELNAEAATAVALQNIGITATDAHSKVVATVALLGASKARGGGAAQAQPSTPQLPPQQLIQPERDWLDRGLQVASILLPGGVPAILSPILAAGTAAKQIAAQTDQARIAGDTTRAQWATVGSIVRDTSATTRDVALGGFQYGGEIVATLGKPNQNTWNVGGDYAGRDLVKPNSGANSGNSGLLNTGSGFINTGTEARITSPGPYIIQPTCTSGAAAAGGQNGAGGSSSVACPITDVQK